MDSEVYYVYQWGDGWISESYLRTTTPIEFTLEGAESHALEYSVFCPYAIGPKVGEDDTPIISRLYYDGVVFVRQN